jgi:uncharacterized protein YjiS (DUF1127 family)
METVTPIATADFTKARAGEQSKSWGGRIKRAFAAIRRRAADRRLRDDLAEMDEALLRDIGIAEDEVHRVRARERFTPRAWVGDAGRRRQCGT